MKMKTKRITFTVKQKTEIKLFLNELEKMNSRLKTLLKK